LDGIHFPMGNHRGYLVPLLYILHKMTLILYTLLSILFAGFCEGFMDWVLFKYDEPNNFWNPELSWRNKWLNGDRTQGEKFWGSSRWFVFLTDGWHLLKFLRNLFLIFASFLVLVNFMPWYQALGCTIIFRAVYAAGFYLSYERLDR
jgi:hypothetical protein